MAKINESRFYELMAELAAVFPNTKIQLDAFPIYFRVLQDSSADIIEKAVIKIMREDDFFPNIKRLSDLCGLNDNQYSYLQVPDGWQGLGGERE